MIPTSDRTDRTVRIVLTFASPMSVTTARAVSMPARSNAETSCGEPWMTEWLSLESDCASSASEEIST